MYVHTRPFFGWGCYQACVNVGTYHRGIYGVLRTFYRLRALKYKYSLLGSFGQPYQGAAQTQSMEHTTELYLGACSLFSVGFNVTKVRYEQIYLSAVLRTGLCSVCMSKAQGRDLYMVVLLRRGYGKCSSSCPKLQVCLEHRPIGWLTESSKVRIREGAPPRDLFSTGYGVLRISCTNLTAQSLPAETLGNELLRENRKHPFREYPYTTCRIYN